MKTKIVDIVIGVEVPEDAGWAAQDECGDWNWFVCEPVELKNRWALTAKSNMGLILRGVPNPDWRCTKQII